MSERERRRQAGPEGARGLVSQAEGVRAFRKKPVVVEAVQYTAKHAEDIANGVRDDFHGFPPQMVSDEDGCIYRTGRLKVQTLESDVNHPHLAEPGDWIIWGVKGEPYPCKPDIFAATYEPADAPPPDSPSPSWTNIPLPPPEPGWPQTMTFEWDADCEAWKIVPPDSPPAPEAPTAYLTRWELSALDHAINGSEESWRLAANKVLDKLEAACPTGEPQGAPEGEAPFALPVKVRPHDELAEMAVVEVMRGNEHGTWTEPLTTLLPIADADFIARALNAPRSEGREPYADWEVRPDDDGVDEIVGTGFLHMERMDDDVWWFGFYNNARDDGRRERLTWTIHRDVCRIIEYPADAPEPLLSMAKKMADAPDREPSPARSEGEAPEPPMLDTEVVECLAYLARIEPGRTMVHASHVRHVAAQALRALNAAPREPDFAKIDARLHDLYDRLKAEGRAEDAKTLDRVAWAMASAETERDWAEAKLQEAPSAASQLQHADKMAEGIVPPGAGTAPEKAGGSAGGAAHPAAPREPTGERIEGIAHRHDPSHRWRFHQTDRGPHYAWERRAVLILRAPTHEGEDR